MENRWKTEKARSHERESAHLEIINYGHKER